MKKIKFFNGISATFALAAVALATTFTSCEKEDFNVNFDPNPAKVIFTPNVIDAATGENVTKNATFTGNEPIVSKTADKTLAADKVTITATVNGVTGSVEVSYPAVAAGEVVSISPVIMLSPDFVFVADASSVKYVGQPNEPLYGNAGGDKLIDHNGKKWATNDTDYYVDYTASWSKTVTVTRKDVETKAFVVNAPYEYSVTQENSVELRAGAWCMYNAAFINQAANIEYLVTSKASGLSATVVYYNPAYISTAKTVEMPLPGHEHAFGHGHGHGGNPNAGGGITLAD